MSNAKNIPKLEIYGFVYKTILPDGRIYIGQTTKINWKGYLGSGVKLLKYFSENGTKGCLKEILKNCYSQNELDKWERIFIKKYKSTDDKIGLNIQLGGTGQGIFAEKTKQKISKSVSKTMTEERRRMISEQHKGKEISEERKVFLSKSMKGKGNPMFGRRGKNSPMFGRSWINNGIESKFINIDNGIPEGFSLGRIYKNKIYGQ